MQVVFFSKKHPVVFSKIFKCPDPNMADYFYHNLHTETYIMFANTYVSVSVSAYLFISLPLWKKVCYRGNNSNQKIQLLH